MATGDAAGIVESRAAMRKVAIDALSDVELMMVRQESKGRECRRDCMCVTLCLVLATAIGHRNFHLRSRHRCLDHVYSNTTTLSAAGPREVILI